MTLSTHQVAAPLFITGLTGLSGVLGKAGAYAAARNIEPEVLLQARLFPDMLPMVRQVQVASDFAKGAVGRLAGDEFPTFEDNETTFEALQARVEKTIAYIRAIDPARLDGSEDRSIVLVRRGKESVHTGRDYLLQQALPNFFFHVTTAYAILRHNGVEIGKRDFLAL